MTEEAKENIEEEIENKQKREINWPGTQAFRAFCDVKTFLHDRSLLFKGYPLVDFLPQML